MATTDNCVEYDIKFFEELHKYLPFNKDDLVGIRKAVEMGLIQRERLAEIAIEAVSGVPIDSRQGMDHADGSDTKTVVSSYRNNSKARGAWTNSLMIRNVKTKVGPLRIIAYNKLLDEFHYFFVPYEAYRNCSSVVEIIIESVNNTFSEPDFSGKPQTWRKWWNYKCESFEEMCMTKATLVDKLFD
jgi:hypothetical protein